MRMYGDGAVLWLTGLAGSGKTTVARALVDRCRDDGFNPILLDGDVLREALGQQHGYDPESRMNMGFSYARIAAALARQRHVVVVATISLFHSIQAWNRRHAPGYFEVFLDVPMDELRRRDKKGLYSGSVVPDMVVGLGQAAQFPESPDVVVRNYGDVDPEQAAALILAKASGAVPVLSGQ